MKKVTLRFPSLQHLAECIFQLSISKPVIDYDRYFLTADLSESQIENAQECQGEVIEIIVAQ